MKWVAALLWVGWLSAAPGALSQQREPVAPIAAHSVSGQFIVHGKPGKPSPVGVVPEVDNHPMVQMTPEILAITSERVKAAVLQRLDAPDRWRGKIHLYLEPVRRNESAQIRIVPQLFREGWYFWMIIPEQVSWRNLVRALTEAVLLEMANRSHENFVQTPLWLNEGIAGLLIAEHGRRLVIEDHTWMVQNQRRPDLLREARALLDGRQPWTFTELGLPDLSELRKPAAWEAFQGSAILLTHELTAPGQSRARLRDAILILSKHLNWQMAFLKAFSGEFMTLLEVEKWWAVNSSFVMARDAQAQWSAEKSLRHLETLTTERIQVTSPTTGRPTEKEVRLGELITETGFAVHEPVLEQKVVQLRRLYGHAPPDVLPLAVDYFETLSGYLEARGANRSPGRGNTLLGQNRSLTRQTVRRLEELDQRLNTTLGILTQSPTTDPGDRVRRSSEPPEELEPSRGRGRR